MVTYCTAGDIVIQAAAEVRAGHTQRVKDVLLGKLVHIHAGDTLHQSGHHDITGVIIYKLRTGIKVQRLLLCHDLHNTGDGQHIAFGLVLNGI